MNTKNLNAGTQNYDEQEGANNTSRLSSEASIQMPQKTHKQTKKAKGAFLTISEVANKLDVQQHVLRFWETKFSHIRPLKRGGGRRYYRPEDVALLQRIHHLLYTEGYTIKGVQKLLREQGKAQIIAGSAGGVAVKSKVQPTADAQPKKPAVSANNRAVLEVMLAELKAMRAMIKV